MASHLWESLVLAIPITAGSVAWLYQKALERQALRIARYEKILEMANAFLRAGRNPDHIDQTLAEIRKLWISAPKTVIDA